MPSVGNLVAFLRVDAAQFQSGMKEAADAARTSAADISKNMQAVSAEAQKALAPTPRQLAASLKGLARQDVKVADVSAQEEQVRLRTAGRIQEAELAAIRHKFDRRIAAAREADQIELAIALQSLQKQELLAAQVAQKQIAYAKAVGEEQKRAAQQAALSSRFSQAFARGFAEGGGSRLSDGQGFAPLVVRSQAEVKGFLRSGTGENGLATQLSAVIPILAATKIGLDASVVAAKVYSGEIKSWPDILRESLRTIPLLGDSIAKFADYHFFGTDLKEELDARQRGERSAYAAARVSRDKTADELIAETARIRESTRIGGLTGLDRELAQIKQTKDEAAQAARAESGTDASRGGQVAQALGAKIAAINERAAADAEQAIRRDREAKEVASARLDIELAIAQGRDAEAERLRINLETNERINEAIRSGNADLVDRIRLIGEENQAIADAKAVEKEVEEIRKANREAEAQAKLDQGIRDLQTENEALQLRAEGRNREARELELINRAEAEAAEALRAGELEKARLIQQRLALQLAEVGQEFTGKPLAIARPDLLATGVDNQGRFYDDYDADGDGKTTPAHKRRDFGRGRNQSDGKDRSSVDIRHGDPNQTALLQTIAERLRDRTAIAG